MYLSLRSGSFFLLSVPRKRCFRSSFTHNEGVIMAASPVVNLENISEIDG